MRMFTFPQMRRPLRLRKAWRGSALVLAVAVLPLAGQYAPVSAADAAFTTASAVEPQGNVVIEWNQTLLKIVRTPPAQPSTIHPTRNFAIMSAAVYDAVNAISRTHPLHGIKLNAPQNASRPAAAAVAAHDVLVALYPAQKTSLDQQLTTDLAAIPAGRAKQDGVQTGSQAAREVLALRAHDGAGAAPPPYTTTGRPGDYRPTPPAFKAPEYTHWGKVTPFVLHAGNQFRPAAPPELNGPAYAAAINEVKAIGAAQSTTRTAEQTKLAQLWVAPAQNYWYDIAQQVALAHHSDLDQSADLFAALNLTLADTTIGVYDAKYTYRLWRPITAIRNAAGNPQVAPDPAWAPLVPTPADPSYPGMHSAISTAAATVLTRFYGDSNSFTLSTPPAPGGGQPYTKTYSSFSATATEAGLSRIWAGLHSRLDHQSGNQLGTAVANYELSQLKQATPSSPTTTTSAS